MIERRWPVCLTEAETLAKMVEGMSIARLGDGELAIATGSGNATHKPNAKLTEELVAVLHNPAPGCLPAIPTMDPAGPRYFNWSRMIDRFRKILDMERVYGSALVGQKKSAPWINTPEHVENFRRIWRGKRAVAVCFTPALEAMLAEDAASTTTVPCLHAEAYSEIKAVEHACVKAKPDVVVAVAGPMATVLANRLAHRGIQCIDLGRGFGLIAKFDGGSTTA